jgi:nitrogen fixation protein NifB
MHLPVAPACNLQCNYCNRKFDCSNESRPGVSSSLLTPEQAVAKVRQVATAIPQLSVVGIAGPGDPLANIGRSFKTLELIREQLPDLKLCLSTNGLMLPDAVDRLLEVGVDHVTVTINTLDPDIAAQIYAWLWLDGERYSGREAGKILVARQRGAQTDGKRCAREDQLGADTRYQRSFSGGCQPDIAAIRRLYS